jgi:tetratricopeptide (TPR) repeat protein
MRHILRYLVFCLAGLSFAEPLSLWGQEPTQVLRPSATSSDTAAEKIVERPLGFTPLEEAQQLFRMGQFDEAINRYKKIVSGGTDGAAAYAGLVRVYLKLKKPNDAYSAARKAVELDPSLATAHSALGEVLFRQGKLDEANTEFLFPLKAGHADPRAYLGLSQVFAATFYFKKAKAAIEKAHDLDPTDPNIFENWIQTRPDSEQIKALEDVITSPSNYYSRAEKAGFKQQLALMKDRAEHPERTCSLANRPDSAELQLQRAEDTTYLALALNVQLNGEKSRLQVSTDDSGVVINGKLAAKMGVQPIVRVDMDDLGDQNPPEGYVGFARTIKIGNLEFRDCYVTVVEHASRGSLFDLIRGRIGAQMFSSYLMDYDIPDRKLKLQPLPSLPGPEDRDSATMDSRSLDARKFNDRYTAPEMGAWERAYYFDGAYFVALRVNDSPPKFFRVSAATDATFITTELARQSAWLISDGDSRAVGLNGTIKRTFDTGPVKLAFGHFIYPANSELSVDLTKYSDDAGTEISGLLGFDVLQNLDFTIDYRDGLIDFEYNKKHQ